MDKKPLILISLGVVVLLVMGSSVPALAKTHFSLTKTIPSISTSSVVNYKTYIGAESQYFILLFGRCKKITLNNQTDDFGILKGDLFIYNERVFGTIENYWIFALDKYNKDTHTKHSLPKTFTLVEFTGYGFMRWIAFPHSPCSQFYIIGEAQFIVIHE
ncbi:MAG: hypothetical protein WC525_01205 [Candidatus Thermoplasmatota archaeon]